jgi:hypothetical protein
MGAYSGQRHDAIAATLALLRHFRAFLASDCREMRDPYEVAEWRDGASRLDKPAAQRKLSWLVHVAINRKAGIPDAPMNHKGTYARKHLPGYQTDLRRDVYRLQDIRRRVRVYQLSTPELAARFGHLLSSRTDD